MVAPPLVDAPVAAVVTPDAPKMNPSPKPRIGWEVLVGGAAWVPSPSIVSMAVVVDAGLLVLERVRLALMGGWSTASEIALSVDGQRRGTLTGSGGLAVATGMYCSTSPLRVCGGLGFGARLSSAVASGERIYQATQVVRAQVMGAGVGQLAWSFGHLRLALDGVAMVSPSPQSFVVEGFSAGLKLPNFEALVRLSVGIGSRNEG